MKTLVYLGTLGLLLWGFSAITNPFLRFMALILIGGIIIEGAFRTTERLLKEWVKWFKKQEKEIEDKMEDDE